MHSFFETRVEAMQAAKELRASAKRFGDHDRFRMRSVPSGIRFRYCVQVAEPEEDS